MGSPEETPSRAGRTPHTLKRRRISLGTAELEVILDEMDAAAAAGAVTPVSTNGDGVGASGAVEVTPNGTVCEVPGTIVEKGPDMAKTLRMLRAEATVLRARLEMLNDEALMSRQRAFKADNAAAEAERRAEQAEARAAAAEAMAAAAEGMAKSAEEDAERSSASAVAALKRAKAAEEAQAEAQAALEASSNRVQEETARAAAAEASLAEATKVSHHSLSCSSSNFLMLPVLADYEMHRFVDFCGSDPVT